MATLRITSDGDPYPIKAGVPLVNNGVERVFPDATTIIDQTHDFEFKYRAGSNTNDPELITEETGAIGITLNGVTIFSSLIAEDVLPVTLTAAPGGFHWNTRENTNDFRIDDLGGRPETTQGQYRYRSGEFIKDMMTNNEFSTASAYIGQSSFGGDNTRHSDGHSKIVGYAFDGFPIYGPYGYSNPTDNNSPIKQIRSSYREKASETLGRVYTYSEVPRGSFIEDYEYVDTLGDLDQHNGRYCITPDYATGTYAYFLTFSDTNFDNPEYPYIIGPSTREQRSV